MPITLKTEKLVPVYPKCLRIHFYRFHLSMITYQKSIMLNMENPQFFLRGEDNHIGLADIQKPDPSITFVKVNFFFNFIQIEMGFVWRDYKFWPFSDMLSYLLENI